jgi:glycosyltransferase involved in cell wall biosynthesis
MIPTYNCTSYLKETLTSILAQDMGEAQMQIEVVDDASTDADVAQLVAFLGGSRVLYYQQPVNVGSLRNFETCLNRAQGHLVHLIHGDDRVVNGFYAQMTQVFQQYPEAGAVFSNYASIDAAGNRIAVQPPLMERGILQNWLLRIAERQYIQYVSIAVRREVYERLGSFYGTNYGEDWEMWVRIARYYPMAYIPDILAEYRGHTASISYEKALRGHMLPDLSNVITNIQQHLPDEDKERIGMLSKRHHANWGLVVAYRILKETKDWSLTRIQIKQALSMSQHPSVFYQLIKLHTKSLFNNIINIYK